jgi:hypothetical protein
MPIDIQQASYHAPATTNVPASPGNRGPLNPPTETWLQNVAPTDNATFSSRPTYFDAAPFNPQPILR